MVLEIQKLDGSCPNTPVLLEQNQTNHIVYLQNIAISQRFRHLGLGSLLIQKAISEFIQVEDCAGVFAVEVKLDVDLPPHPFFQCD